jgi:hypothetical protein
MILTFNEPDVKSMCMNYRNINIKQEQPKLEMTDGEYFHAGYFTYLLQFQG